MLITISRQFGAGGSEVARRVGLEDLAKNESARKELADKGMAP